jgi:hypothetical protein
LRIEAACENDMTISDDDTAAPRPVVVNLREYECGGGVETTVSAENDKTLADILAQQAAAQARRNAVSAECVATPDDVIRTAVRLLLLTAHDGLRQAPPDVRQSIEARDASQALYAAGEYFNGRSFDASTRDDQLQRLCDALIPLAAAHRFDPFMLHLYATGRLKWRKKKRGTVAAPLRDR